MEQIRAGQVITEAGKPKKQEVNRNKDRRKKLFKLKQEINQNHSETLKTDSLREKFKNLK